MQCVLTHRLVAEVPDPNLVRARGDIRGNPEVRTLTAVVVIDRRTGGILQAMNEYSAYVGLDVHKDSIAVAVALPGPGEPFYREEIVHRRGSLRRLMSRLSPHGEVLNYCYESGPCGYGVYLEISEAGHECAVVAPSLIPRRVGDRVQTDRRDALTLARWHRSGNLTSVEDSKGRKVLSRLSEIAGR